MVELEQILLRIGPGTPLGWGDGLGFGNGLIGIVLVVGTRGLRTIKHLDQLLLDGRGCIAKGVPDNPPRMVTGVLELFLLFFPLLSLPQGLEVAIEFVRLISHLEILDLHLELFSTMLVLDLLDPLAGLAEVLLGIKLLSLLLDDDSVDVSKAKVVGDLRLLDQNLLLEFVKIF
jgi:hypothetical protein